MYAPTSDGSKDKIEDFYNQVDGVFQSTLNHEDTKIIGDFNAKIGKGSDGYIVGSIGLGDRNEKGDRLVQFCRKK